MPYGAPGSRGRDALRLVAAARGRGRETARSPGKFGNVAS